MRTIWKRITTKIKEDWWFFFPVPALIILMYLNHKSEIKNKEVWKEKSCPSLLSIARSSRDTLIVMKFEPICNEYVMDTLK
jgi:hypothetical protein